MNEVLPDNRPRPWRKRHKNWMRLGYALIALTGVAMVVLVFMNADAYGRRVPHPIAMQHLGDYIATYVVSYVIAAAGLILAGFGTIMALFSGRTDECAT